MIPIILVSDSAKNYHSFIRDFVKKNSIDENYVFTIKPLGKEFSIEQIREIKKNIIYNFSKLHLYLLYDFDSASFEAQNAFLKTLEEHQQTIQFILIVKNHHKLAGTILSRSKVINFRAVDDFLQDKEFNRALSQFLTSLDLKILGGIKFQVKQINNPADLFKKLTLFFRQRLAIDPKSTQVLREILSVHYAVENNHVDPQSAIDHLLLHIRRLYSSSKPSF